MGRGLRWLKVVMRSSCVIFIHLLAIVFSTLEKGESSLVRPGRRKNAKTCPYPSSSDGSNLANPLLDNDIEKDVEEVGQQPKVLKMDVVEFGNCSDKKELTKGLTAKQWNELLEKFCVEGGEHGEEALILCNSSEDSKEELLGVLEDNLREDPEHLFRDMCELACAPRMPSVIELLEEGLKVYPRLRHSILLVIYQHGYPATKWHLGDTREDLGLLRELIEQGLIKREAIARHLVEVAALYSPEILKLLIDKGIVTVEDLCTMDMYRKVCGRGGKGYLQWAKGECALRPDQECFDAAVSGGHEHVVDFIVNDLGIVMVPSPQAVDKAAAAGMLTLLVNKCHGWRLFPTKDGADEASKNGHVELQRWLAARKSHTATPESNDGIDPQGRLPSGPEEQSSIQDVELDMIEASEKFEGLTIDLERMVALRERADEAWNLCMDKMKAYSQNRDFFKTALPALMRGLEGSFKFKLRPENNADTGLHTALNNMKAFCEERSRDALLSDLKAIWFVISNCNAFEEPSDEFLALMGEYMQSTIAIRKLYLMLEDTQTLTGPRFQVADDRIYKSSLLELLVRLKTLLRDLCKPGFADTYSSFLSALEAARRAVVPVNKDLLSFFVYLNILEISSLGVKAQQSLAALCGRVGLEKTAQKTVADITHTMLLLQRESLKLNRDAAGQQRAIEQSWGNLLRSVLAFEEVSSKADIESLKKVSEAFSEMFNTFVDTFLAGEDEAWTCGLAIKLIEVFDVWEDAAHSFESASTDAAKLLCCMHYKRVAADMSASVPMIRLVEILEDPLALDRQTRGKLAEYWREARALSRLSDVLKTLSENRSDFVALANAGHRRLVEMTLSNSLKEEIDILAKQPKGITFQKGKYHAFIDELPERQYRAARFLKKISDSICCKFDEYCIRDKIPTILSHWRPLRLNGFLRPLIALFKSCPEPLPESSLQSRPQISQSQIRTPCRNHRKNNKEPKNKAIRITKAPASDGRQVFVQGGTRYVSEEGASNNSANHDMDEREEQSVQPWTVVTKPRHLYVSKSLIQQPAQEILKRFRSEPMGWDGVIPTNPQDPREDKKRVKVAVFNVRWLFLFDLATEKLYDRVEWKSLVEAWNHIKEIAEAIRKISADIICLCEVQDLRILSILVELLPDLKYHAYLIPGHDSLSQNVGILTKINAFNSISAIKHDYLPKNLVLDLNLENGRGRVVRLVLTGVHLISTTPESDPVERARIRAEQAKELKKHLMREYGSLKDIVYLVAGDFNMVDPQLCPGNSQASETALETVKDEHFKLWNAIKVTKANSDLCQKSLCHIFISQDLSVHESYIGNLGRDGACYWSKEVSDHPPVVVTLLLPD